ncbi:MAG: ATP-dependent sacrificial sulfur transferase LarE [Acidobacteria bacterium]|nr:ATP-dependent sacrificial sulfur transferase LarE [Acidobacteriota bacterium]
MSELEDKIKTLQSLLSKLEQVLVCFSGGVDSGYLLAESLRAVGDKAVALTAVSPSLPPEEGADARRLAEQLGARHLLLETQEVDDPRYAANPLNRCYFCKIEMYGVAVEQARQFGIPHVLDGFNADDRADYRPGRQAAREWGVRSPLDEIGFTKAEIREAARQVGLPVWDKPALACLSSRFPYGTQITSERLSQVWRCERALRETGFRICRVRYYGAEARIEVAQEEVSRLFFPNVREEILRQFREAGFHSITVDLQGYRSGSLNEVLLPRQERSQDSAGIVKLA